MALTRVTPNIIAVANNVTNKTVGNTTSIPSFTFDGSGVVTSASNVAISGAGITANTVANSAFQTGSVENYLRGANLDFGMRNRIINGAMTIDQRNTTISASDSGWQYAVDRWAAYQNISSSKFTLAGSSTAPTGFTNSLLATSSSAYSLGASEFFTVRQPIEGFNTADLGWGTANAKTVTLSFWVRSSVTGTFAGFIQNANDGSRTYPFTYTISSANTFEQKSITIAGDTSGTWLTNNGAGPAVCFSMGCGSTYLGTANAWTGSTIFGVTGQTNLVATNGATWYVTGCQLEVGSTATSFDYLDYGRSLIQCQRYYYVITRGAGAYFANGFYYSSSHMIAIVQFPVTMRATPTLSATSGADYYQIYRNSSNDGFNSLTLSSVSNITGSLQNTTEISGTSGVAGGVYADNASILVAVQAEL